MPTFVSDGGKWYPAKERVALKNKSDMPFKYNGETIQPGDDFIYQGPDRQALKELAEAGLEYFGQDFRDSSEFHEFINQKHQGNMDLYLKRIGYNEKEDKDKFKEMYEKVNRHDLPKRVQEIIVMGGGRDTADGGLSHVGGFGDQRLRSSAEVKQGA